MKARIYVRQQDNDRFFNQKLSTFRNGFCYIEREVTFIPDPHECYDDGQYGYITVGGKQVIVIGEGNSFEIA